MLGDAPREGRGQYGRLARPYGCPDSRPSPPFQRAGSSPRMEPPSRDRPVGEEEGLARSQPPKHLVIFGRPGSGKSSLAERLGADFGYQLVRTGEMLREAIRRGDFLGQRVESHLARGDLVPDQLDLRTARAEPPARPTRPGSSSTASPGPSARSSCSKASSASSASRSTATSTSPSSRRGDHPDDRPPRLPGLRGDVPRRRQAAQGARDLRPRRHPAREAGRTTRWRSSSSASSSTTSRPSRSWPLPRDEAGTLPVGPRRGLGRASLRRDAPRPRTDEGLVGSAMRTVFRRSPGTEDGPHGGPYDSSHRVAATGTEAVATGVAAGAAEAVAGAGASGARRSGSGRRESSRSGRGR